MAASSSIAPGAPGRTGSFTRIRELAKGGMGRVDLVLRREGRFERLYAVKRMHSHYQDDDALRGMFLDEARIAGLIRHPNVVSVLDVGEDEDGPFLVMDYIEGVPVSTLVSGTQAVQEELPVPLCLEVIAQVAEGLHAAHELVGHDGKPLGLVHRDVSPQNILVGFDGNARVTDFGIAKAFGRTTRTSTGLLKGKMGYMSPEQLAFQHPDRRSDLFSLGVVLYEMLAGERLYRDDDPTDTAQRILKDPPPDIGEVREDVPIDVVALLFELLAKEPDARPANAGIVSERLRAVLSVLAMEHGALSIPTWLEQRFGTWREQQRQAVARALEATRPGIQIPEMDALFAHRTPSLPTSGFVRRVRNRTWWWVAAGAAVGVAIVGGAALFFMDGDDRAGARAEPAVTREAPAGDPPEEPVAVAPAEPLALPEVRVEVPPTDTIEESEPTPEASEPDVARPRHPHRGHRRTKKRVPIWGWE